MEAKLMNTKTKNNMFFNIKLKIEKLLLLKNNSYMIPHRRIRERLTNIEFRWGNIPIIN